MQYSSNSNRAIENLVRGCPTLIGQYRQAKLQARDRQMALDSHAFEERKTSAQIELKQAKIGRLRAIADAPYAVETNAARIKLIEIEIEELQYGLERARELVADAQRELAACQALIDRVEAEFGRKFDELPEEEFQALMAVDFQEKTQRWVAARFLAQQLGLPPETMEVLLEMPEGDRAATLNRIYGLMNQYTLGNGQQIT